jgi:hypothetical protein
VREMKREKEREMGRPDLLLVFLKCMELLCSLHPEVFRVSYFPQGMEVISSSLFIQGQLKG